MRRTFFILLYLPDRLSLLFVVLSNPEESKQKPGFKIALRCALSNMIQMDNGVNVQEYETIEIEWNKASE